MLDAGIVDENIEPAEVAQGRRDHLGDRIGRGHIGRRIAGLDPMVGFYRILCPGDLVCSSKAVQPHFSPSGGGRGGDAKTDSTGRAGHQCDLADEMSCLAGGLRFDLDIHVPNLLAAATPASDGSEICLANRTYGNTLWL